MTFFQELEAALDTTLQADRHRLRNRLRGVRKLEEQGRPFDRPLQELQRDLEASAARRSERAAGVPPIKYDPQLPVVTWREEIAAAIRDHQVVVVCGETGSGKSTQLPKICLELGRGIDGLIGHTQPRRIAARSVAARVAEELGTPLGSTVGFKVRFADQTSPQTLIKVMTDGVLLAETQHDRFLDQYDTLIIDEAHERSLNIDFLLGYLHRLLPKRPDLRVIITSATIDAARFAKHFGRMIDATQEPPLIDPAPIVQVEGRTYPVDLLYRPPLPDPDSGEVDELRGVVQAVEEILTLGPGDILTFLPTERDILEAHQRLRGWEKQRGGGHKIEIVPLYARLSTAEQSRVFQPHSGRRIVLATNVAESSLTVPGIRFVIDTGTARISRYSPRSQVQRLPIEAVSRASADQRKGRCGRIGPGVCIRLYSEEDYVAREAFTPPEIQRTNLAGVILQTLSLGLGPLDEFPLLDPPRAESIRDGRRTLHEIGAIDEQYALTPLGKRLARLPVDPRIGRMLLAADEEHCLADMLIIAAALETQDPRDRPIDKQQQADQAHAAFSDADSDFVSYLRLWDFHQRLKQTVSRSELRRAAKQNFLSEVRLREWHDLHRQLLELVGQLGLKAGRRRLGPFDRAAEKEALEAAAKPNAEKPSRHSPGDYAAVHRALLTGLLSNIALRGETSEYTAGGNQKLFLWPGSGVFARKPKWIVAAELVETTRRYARTAAWIDPDWLEPLAPHLVKRSYSDPYWDARGGGAMAYERVSLFGLTIVARRRARYGPIDPKLSRRLLLQHGLVEGQMTTRGSFFKQNQSLLEEIAALSAKTRQRALIVDEDRIYDFYNARVPVEVIDLPSFERWRTQAEKQNPKLLLLTREDLLPQDTPVAAAEHFPDQLEIGRTRLNLEYRFEPGTVEDGVTVTVPVGGLGQLAEDRLDWLVPGLLHEKIEALIRSLPKAVRTKFTSAADVARRVARELKFGEGPFLTAVASALSKVGSEYIAVESFDLARLPTYLQVQVRVVDSQGKVLEEGRDLPALRERFQVQQVATAPPVPTQWHRDGITAWDFGELPGEVEIPARPHPITKHVAILDQGETVALRLVDTSDDAARLSHAGLRRLLVLSERRELRAQVDWLPGMDRLALYAAPFCRERPLVAQVIDLLCDRAWRALRYRRPDSREEFELLRKDLRREIVPAVQAVSKVLAPLCEAYHQIRLALDGKHPANWQATINELRQQLADLTPTNFLTETPAEWLDHYPRYLRGMSERMTKLAGGLATDRKQAEIITPLDNRLRERVAQQLRRGIHDGELVLYRWMLEEFRISLYAQKLGTAIPISPQRLEKQWAKVRA
ncbi:MAG TPA: ATP-dependent RNA helicase HrpA [Pirellulaceae bacterium]|nr:ATP-dependent RNA helicase HrpA [Pirellulaceae bacterium]